MSFTLTGDRNDITAAAPLIFTALGLAYINPKKKSSIFLPERKLHVLRFQTINGILSVSQTRIKRVVDYVVNLSVILFSV